MHCYCKPSRPRRPNVNFRRGAEVGPAGLARRWRRQRQRRLEDSRADDYEHHLSRLLAYLLFCCFALSLSLSIDQPSCRRANEDTIGHQLAAGGSAALANPALMDRLPLALERPFVDPGFVGDAQSCQPAKMQQDTASTAAATNVTRKLES